MTLTDEAASRIRIGLHALVDMAHGMAKSKGWYDDGQRNTGELLMLAVSELAEALEELRAGHPVDLVYAGANGKPEGFVVEIADCVIRLADLCGALGLDLGDAVVKKARFNAGRERKHGKAL